MDDYKYASSNLKKIADEIKLSSTKSEEIISIRDETSKKIISINEKVKENDENQAEILSILFKKIKNLEGILK